MHLTETGQLSWISVSRKAGARKPRTPRLQIPSSLIIASAVCVCYSSRAGVDGMRGPTPQAPLRLSFWGQHAIDKSCTFVIVLLPLSDP